MSATGPIIIVEDDADDREIIEDVFFELGVSHKLIFFETSPPVITFLKTTSEKPFLILSDINIPQMTGIELREKINADEELRKKSIPFIFYSTTAGKVAVDRAYDMMVQGFFEKPFTRAETKRALKLIVDYWDICCHPNKR